MADKSTRGREADIARRADAQRDRDRMERETHKKKSGKPQAEVTDVRDEQQKKRAPARPPVH